MKHCQSERTKRERELRKRRGEERQFNDPLRVFIERKHPEIYDEYVQLYKRLKEENPTRKNLVTSKTFKEWLVANPLRVQNVQTSNTIQLLTPQLVLEPVPIPNKVQEDLPHANNITAPLQETVEAQLPELDDDVINEIMKELTENQDLQNLLERLDVDDDNDEGVELYPYEEIEMDIEPFDFNIEVELYDF